MNEYKLSDIITKEEGRELCDIVHAAHLVHRTPHAGLMNYINARPGILENCKRVGLLPDFFAYQFEAIVTPRTQR